MPRLIQITSICVAVVAVGAGLASAGRLLAPTDNLPAGSGIVATLSPFRPFASSPVRSGSHLFDQGDQPDGQKLFQTRCFVCHGRNGKGDGPSSSGLAEKPQDLTEAQIAGVIAYVRSLSSSGH